MKTISKNMTVGLRGGFTLVEVIIYTALLGLILGIMLTSYLVIAESQDRVTASRSVDRSGSFALERVVREVRMSSAIDGTASTFGEQFSSLALDRQSDDPDALFYVDDGTLFLDIGANTLQLTHSGVSVNGFLVEHISTNDFEGVKVELELSRNHSDGVIEQTFWGTALSRGTYQ